MRLKKSDSVQMQKDRDDLRKLGYIQELNRSMGTFSNFAASFAIISILTGLNSLYGYGLEHGGIACIWMVPCVGLCQLAVAGALSEIASLYPVAGGVYKWTTMYSNKTFGWFCGWISLIGWIACVAGADYGFAQFVAAFFNISLDNKTTMLTLIGFIILTHTIMNLYGIKLVRFCCDSSVVVHLVGVILITALLFIFGRVNTMEDISISHALHSGYTWGGILQTILLSTWTLMGFDASANVSEESLNPSRSVPFGMIMSIAISTLLGTLYLLSIGLATGDVSEVIHSGQPATIYVISTVLGPVVSKYVVAVVIYAMFICGLSAQTLLIRKIYALSRDNVLPASNVLKIVSSKYEIPHFSGMLAGLLPLILCVFIMFLPFDGLPMIASLSTLGIYSSHAIAIAVSFSSKNKNRKGPFNLKWASMPIKVIACIWQMFICGIVCYYNVSSGVLLLVLMIAVTIYYFVSGRENIYGESITLTEDDLIRIESRRKHGERRDHEN